MTTAIETARQVNDLAVEIALLAAESSAPWDQVRIVMDDGRAALRCSASDDVEVRLRHRKARHRRHVVVIPPGTGAQRVHEMIVAGAEEIASRPPFCLYVEAYPEDPDDQASEWCVSVIVDHVSGKEASVLLGGGFTRDQAAQRAMAIYEVGRVLLELQEQLR